MPKFPWSSFAEPWTADIGGLKVDGVEKGNCVDAPRARVRLDHVELWDSATLEVDISTNEPAPNGVQGLTGLVVLSVPQSNVRLPFRLEAEGDNGRRFSGSVTVQRADLAGAGKLSFEVAGQVDDRHRVVGAALPWSIIIDASQAPTPPGKPPFANAWIDFSSPTAPKAAGVNPAAYAVMDLTEAEPCLLLNEGVDGLKSLLLAEKPQKERRRLREVLGTSVAMQAAAALIRAAAAEVVPIDDDDAEPQPPNDPLHVQMCEAVALEMTSTGSTEEFYEKLLSAEQGPAPERALFWLEVDAAIDRLVGHSAAVSKVVEEVKRV